MRVSNQVMRKLPMSSSHLPVYALPQPVTGGFYDFSKSFKNILIFVKQ